MSNQLRRRYDIIINGGGIVGSTAFNLILKSPYLNRCKVSLIEQASKQTNLKQSPRLLGGPNDPEWNQSDLNQSCKRRFSNRVSSITKASRIGLESLGAWDRIAQYSKDVRWMRGHTLGGGIMFNQTASMSYDNSNKVHQTIHNLITNSKKPVFVFMKGVPSEPLCRYSGVVVQILDAYGVEYDSCDVLENDEIRQEIKSYSDWPTIPQVYKDGSFIGGCDILLQMHQSGELKQLFGGGGGGNSEGESPPK